RRTRAVVVIAGHGEAGTPADVELLRGAAKLRFEAERRGVAGEDDVIRLPRVQLGGERRHDRIGMAEAVAAPQPAEVDPRRQPFVEPVAKTPFQRGRRDMNIAQVSQPNHVKSRNPLRYAVWGRQGRRPSRRRPFAAPRRPRGRGTALRPVLVPMASYNCVNLIRLQKANALAVILQGPSAMPKVTIA